MDADRFQRLSELFEHARDLPEGERARYLEGLRADDAALADELERLLEHDSDDAGLPGEELVQAARPARPALDRVGRFRIVGRIGEGGMGTVYEAEQDQPRRRVALKLLRPDLFSDDMIERFRREVQVLGALRHPGIAQIHDAGTEPVLGRDTPYFVMELIAGRSLTEYAREARLDTPARLELMARVCDAVHHAHEAGVVHRDLKPANILVEESRQPKVLDFGVARMTNAETRGATMTGAGQLVGTLPYMSPEQIRGNPDELDARTDVYSLGVVLYELLADRLPYPVLDRPLYEAVRVVHEQEPTPLGTVAPRCRGDIETVVHKALRKDRRDRYASAAALAADLRRHLANEPIEARPPSTIYRLRKFARRHRPSVIAAGVVLVALAVAIAVVWGRDEADSAEAYRVAVVGAAAALASHDVATAQRLLADAPEEERGWEWHHLDAIFRSPEDRVALDRPVAGAAWTDDGEGVVAVTTAGRVVRWTPGEARAEPVGALDTTGLVARWDTLATSRSFVVRDGTRVLGFNDKPRHVTLWDVATGGVIREFRHYRNYGIARGGGAVAYAGAGHVWLYREAADGAWVEVADLDFQGQTRRLLEFPPDGSHVLVGTSSFQRGHVDVFEMERGTRVFHHESPAFPTAAAWSPDGRRFAVADNRGTITVWGVDGARGAVLAAPVSQSLALDAGGTRVAASAGPTVLLLSLEQADVLRVFAHDEPVTGLAFAPDDARLLTAAGAELRAWDATAGGSSIFAHNSGVLDVSFSPDGHRALSCGFYGHVRVWSAADEAPLADLKIGDDSVPGALFSRDGRWIVSSHGNGEVALTVADTGATPRRWKTKSDPRTLALSPDGGVVTGGAVWSLPDGTPRRDVPDAGIALSPDGGLAAYVAESRVTIHDARSGELRARLPGDRATTAVFGPDGRILGVGHEDGAVRLWDAATGAEVAALHGHGNQVRRAAFAPDGTRLVTASDDGFAIVWSVPDGRELLRLPHKDCVWCVAFSPDGRTVLTGCRDGTIRFWHARPFAERRAAAARWTERRAAERPRVERLLAESGPEGAASALRSDASLSPEEREAALQALLQSLGR